MAPNADGQQSEIFNRMIFHTRYQEENESLPDFAACLKTLLRVCGYAADCVVLDGLARDRFIAGITDKELQAYLTTQPESISFDNVIELCVHLQNSLIKTEKQETEQIYTNDCPGLVVDSILTLENTTNVFDIKFENGNEGGTVDLLEPLCDREESDISVENEKLTQCFYCDYQADEKCTLEKHMLAVHGTEKLFKCILCEFSTGWKSSLRKHKLKVHNETDNCTYSCDECGFSTKFSRVYKNHLMSLKISGKCETTDEKHDPDQYKPNEPMKCPHCNYTRTQRSKILNHIKSVHEDAKPFKCSQCKSSFKLKFRLTAHMKLSHGDGKKYQCQFCSHMTAHKKRLDEHIRAIHNKEKNFVCDKCNFSTSWSGTLSKHMWVVHQEGAGNTYTCESCGYSTRDKKLYKNHLMNLHNIGEYKPGLCTICGKTFKTRDYLRDHVFKVHKKKLKDLVPNSITSDKDAAVVS